jgi:hypothetical protein
MAATLETLISNVARIAGFVKVYADLPRLNAKQTAALNVNLGQLFKNLTALAAYTPPTPVVVALAAPLPEAIPVETPPNFGVRQEMSSGLYNEWVSDWIQRTFPAAYVDWPPMVGAIEPGAIATAATEAGCLAQVSAAGTLGFPGGPWHELGEWSLYTALVSTDGVHRVFHMGKLVGSQDGGDGLEFAHSLGFNW